MQSHAADAGGQGSHPPVRQNRFSAPGDPTPGAVLLFLLFFGNRKPQTRALLLFLLFGGGKSVDVRVFGVQVLSGLV